MHPMDALLRPPDPDLQASLRHLRRIAAAGALALGLLGAAAVGAGPVDAAAGDPSQWGVARSVAGGEDPEIPSTPGLTRKVNEYEGQHRRVNEYEGQHRRAGRDPEVPVSPN